MATKQQKRFNTDKVYSLATQDSFWLTILSVISCLSVVFLHSNRCYWEISVNSPEWIFSNVIETIFYFAVPCFFGISGATLIDYKKKYPTSVYFKKRVKKTLIPYLFFSIVICIPSIFFKNIPGPDVPAYIFNFLVQGQAPAYWFFPYLFILYLFIPIIGSIKEEKTRENVCFGIIIVGFISAFLLPFIVKLANNAIAWPWALEILVYPLTYACIGYLLRKYTLKMWLEIIFYVLAVGGLITQCVGTQFLSLHDGKINPLLKGYENIPCFFHAVGMMLLIKRLSIVRNPSERCRKVFSFTSKYTFDIYLVHYLLLMGLDILYSQCFHVPYSSPIYILTSPIICVGILILLMWGIKKIPYVNKVINWVLP